MLNRLLAYIVADWFSRQLRLLRERLSSNILTVMYREINSVIVTVILIAFIQVFKQVVKKVVVKKKLNSARKAPVCNV